MTALGYAACQRGHSVLFTGAIDIINTLAAAHAAGGIKRALAAYVKPEVLCIDELGYQRNRQVRRRLPVPDHQPPLRARRHLVRRQFANNSGGIYSAIAHVHVAEARGFVAASEERYDLIHGGAARFLQRFLGRPVRAVPRTICIRSKPCRTICGTCGAAACWRSRAGSTLPPRNALKLVGADRKLTHL